MNFIRQALDHTDEVSSSECKYVGEGQADIAGIGILVGFVGQALLSLVVATWAFFFSKGSNLDVIHDEGTIEYEIEQKRLEFISDMLMVGNDIQMLLGSSYMITVFASADTIDLYHLHLVFDISCFVGVSSAAALVCWTFCNVKLRQPKRFHHTGLVRRTRSAHFTPRHRAVYSFAAMFLALTILLCLRLNEWSPEHEPGRCYHTAFTSRPGANHPAADRLYVIVTGAYMLIAVLAAAFSGARWRRFILVSAFLQFPLHLYMALALRSANQGKLSGEETHENNWDFGQTTAVVLLGVAFRELFNKGREFFTYERALRKNGPSQTVRSGSSLHGVVEEEEDSGLGPAEEETGYHGAGGLMYDGRVAEERTPLAIPMTVIVGQQEK